MSKADEAALFREQSYISFLSALWQFPLHHAHCGLFFHSAQRIGEWSMTGQSHSTKAVSGVLSYSLISGINPDCVQALSLIHISEPTRP